MRKINLQDKKVIGHRTSLEDALKQLDGSVRVYRSYCIGDTFGKRGQQTQCVILTGDQKIHLFLGSLDLRALGELSEILNIAFWPELDLTQFLDPTEIRNMYKPSLEPALFETENGPPMLFSLVERCESSITLMASPVHGPKQD